MDALGSDSMLAAVNTSADTLRDDFARGVHAQFAAARFERRLVPRAADLERLTFVAGFGRTEYAPAAVCLRIKDRECAEPVRPAWLTMNAWHNA